MVIAKKMDRRPKMAYVRSTHATRSTRTRRAAYRRKKPAAAPRRRRVPARRGAGLFSAKPAGQATYAPPAPQRQRGFLPFATSYNVRLPWSHTSGFTAPALQVSGVLGDYSLSSAYDPDQTGVGHQPMQWDQLSGLYKRYMVHGAKFTLEFSNPTADGLFVGYGIRFTGDPGPHSGYTLDVLAERRNVVMRPIQNTGTQKVVFSQYIPLHRVFGLPKMIYNADRETFSGLTGNLGTGSNPSRHVLMTPLIVDSTGGTATVTVRIGVVFYASLYEPLWQSQS